MHAERQNTKHTHTHSERERVREGGKKGGREGNNYQLQYKHITVNDAPIEDRTMPKACQAHW